MVYSKTGAVTASMCDSSVKLSHLAILQLVEDGVTDLMGDLHIDGVTAMREYNAMWVFVKNVIHISRRPDWRTNYLIRSFISCHSAAKLMVDTEILTGSEHVPVAQSRLELCALDLKTGRIRKAETVGIKENTPCEQALSDLKFSRFKHYNTELMDTVRVQYTNLDYCSHTNNIEYIRFILNTYQAEDLENQDIEQIEVHYGQQTFEGDILSVSKSKDGIQDYFSISSERDTAVECMINWKMTNALSHKNM